MDKIKPKHINSRTLCPYSMSIYDLMEKNWEIYSLMSGIALIEEMKKPTKHIQIKISNDKLTKYSCYYTIRFKMINEEIIERWLKITKKWEKKFGLQLIGPSFSKLKEEKKSGQYYIIFSPTWLYKIMKTINTTPSKKVNDICFDRLLNLRNSWGKKLIKESEIKKMIKLESKYKKLFFNKVLAAGAFIISFDLEFRGITTGNLSLCMTNKYQDFMQFMLKLANKWNWATSTKLSNVNLDHSLSRGINASPKSEFRLNTNSIEEIYNLAGPLFDPIKEKYIQYHIKRLKLGNIPGKQGKTKQIILNTLKKFGPMKSTELLFYTNVRTDVILEHLNDLKKQGLVIKERKGKGYIWRYKSAD